MDCCRRHGADTVRSYSYSQWFVTDIKLVGYGYRLLFSIHPPSGFHSISKQFLDFLNFFPVHFSVSHMCGEMNLATRQLLNACLIVIAIFELYLNFYIAIMHARTTNKVE